MNLDPLAQTLLSLWNGQQPLWVACGYVFLFFVFLGLGGYLVLKSKGVL